MHVYTQGEGRALSLRVAALGWVTETGSCMWMSKNASLACLCGRAGPGAAVGLPRNLGIHGGGAEEPVWH